jgi:hypothetical protein
MRKWKARARKLKPRKSLIADDLGSRLRANAEDPSGLLKTSSKRVHKHARAVQDLLQATGEFPVWRGLGRL